MKGKHAMDTVKISMAVTVDGQSDGHDFPALQVDEAKRLGLHLLEHAQKEIIKAWPDNAADAAGDKKVSFDYVVTSSAGVELFRQTMSFGSVNDAAIQVTRGIFDGAMAKLDKKLATKGHKHDRAAGA